MIYVELVDGENNRHWHDIMSDEYSTPTIIESVRALMSCEITPREVGPDWKLNFFQIEEKPHFTCPPFGPAVVNEAELVRADQITEGDIIDLDGDSIADPKGDGIGESGHVYGFEFELSEVTEVKREGPGTILIGGEGFLFAFPADHMLKRMGHDNRAENE